MALTVTADDILRDVFNTDEGRRDPYPLFRRLHNLTPFHHYAADGMWYATRYETVKALLVNPRLGHDEERVFRQPGMTEEQRLRMRERFAARRRRGFSMITENPPDHTRLRRLVSRAFTTPRVEGLRDRVAAVVAERLDALADQGECDMMEVFAFPLPVTVIGELVGVPEGDRARFRPLITEGMRASQNGATEEDMARAEKNFNELEEFFTSLIALRRSDPQDDMLSALISVRDEEDGRLDEDELMSTIFLLFFAGFVTTTNVIGNGLLGLARHPDQLDLLWSDPAMVNPAIEELLRYDSPVPFVTRDVLEPVEAEGVQLDTDAHVVCMLGAANHDPERFEDPDTLKIDRPDNTPVTFGWGIHHCLGAPLARLELQMAFAGLRERFSSIEVQNLNPDRMFGILRGLKELPVKVTPR